MGYSRHIMQVVELSPRFWLDAVQIVSKPPATRNGGPIYRFWASRPCGPAGWLTLLLIKVGDVQVPQRHLNKSGFAIYAISKLTVGCRYG